ncbi:MAG: alpha/beta fold hydrolase [Gallionella sp.]|nr:alpha/beta fold hydrolase [Gallionella sp.]
MSLHIDRFGDSGAQLLFIHGWGMHGGMWGGVLTMLAEHFQVMSVDLPGHGFSAASGQLEVVSGKSAEPHTHHLPLATDYSHLDSIVDQLAAQFTGQLAVCGWSLGGQVALRWAMRHPAQVTRLIAVSSTPCFVQRVDWPCAMAADTLADFSAALQQDYLLTLRRFLALQVRGSERERELLAGLRKLLQSRGEPDLAALQSGLEILREVDLRDELSQISQPALVIAGVRDTLTPLTASQYMAACLPAAQLVEIAGAAHAPFLSHPDTFVKHVVDFLHE